jgi:hypothetical protein
MRDETNQYCASPTVRETNRVGLFVIRMRGRDLFWTCSTEHGCGWGALKQSFTKLELGREIRRLIEDGRFCDIEVQQLELMP